MRRHRAHADNPPGPWRQRIVEFLGLRRSIVGLLLLVVLVGLGERIGDRFLPIYLLAVGGGTWAIGTFQALTNLLGALYAYPGGYLADRYGVRTALTVFSLTAIVGYAIVVLVPAWQAVLVGALFFLSWSALSMPAMISLVASALPPQKRTMGVSLHSLVRRVPMALGPVLGGLCIVHWGERTGIRIAFVGAIAAALVALWAQQRLVAPTPAASAPHRRWALNPIRHLRQMRPELRQLLISDILIRFCEQMPYAFVVIWCMATIRHPVSAVEFGVLTTIEMTTATIVYLPVAHLADRLGKKSFVFATFIFFALFPLVLLVCHSFWPLVAAFVLRGLKEFGEPTRKALIVDLCPTDQRATMFGFYYLVRDTVVATAAILGAALWSISPTWNLLAASAFGVAGSIWFAIRGRDLHGAAAEASSG
ncbi:MAG TPA: MFS transporter [Phycisphaerae bacterium]|nr:MFS transporter [Phycisphaerales bacterium]HRX84903.1 MFS transporter [Phycisphaerae bacterium]